MHRLIDAKHVTLLEAQQILEKKVAMVHASDAGTCKLFDATFV